MEEILLQLFNLLLLLGILFFFSRKKLANYFFAQKEDLQRSMKSAAEGFEKIQSEYEEIKDRVENLGAQLQEIRDEAGYSLERERRRIKSETEAYIDKLQKDTDQKMDQAFENSRRQIERELLEIAMAAARTRLESKMTKAGVEWANDMIHSAEEQQKAKAKNYAS